jgi:hypothetical protein
MLNRLVIMMLSLMLAACFQAVQNKRDAILMPEAVAKSILEKYVDADWVNDPYGRHICRVLKGRDGTFSMPYSTITAVNNPPLAQFVLQISQSKLIGFGFGCVIFVKPDRSKWNQDEINDITDALVSLGAPLDEIQKKKEESSK